MADDAVAEGRLGSVVEGRYKLIEVMASGAMGSVYRAERVPVGKVVAVKFLHASFANDSEFQARFERETRVMSKLAHPNCVSVLDFGVWENAPYLVMDFVAGITLRARIDKGAIEPVAALGLARQIAAGLAHAHEQGVFHRDIKPANIMITEEIGHGERVRILDFGLARLHAASGGKAGRDATQTNMVVGTPNYMSPEQTVPGGNIDARSDIYAVGVVLFEMVVGERPFAAEDTMQLLGMHRAAPIPRLADRVKGNVSLPDGLQEIVDTAMAKSPAARYQTAMELAEAIEEVIGARSGGIVIEPQKRGGSVPVRRPTGATAAGVAPTMVDISKRARSEPSFRDYDRPQPSRFLRTMFGSMILIGGAVGVTSYLLHNKAEQSDSELNKDALANVGSASGDASEAIAMADDASVELTDAAEPDAAILDASIAIDSDVAPVVTIDAGSALGSNAGSGVDDVELDPTTAVDLDPKQGTAATAQDEAPDAPKTKDEAEQHAPATPAPQLATNLHDAVQMIKDGKRTQALASLRALQKTSPKSAYISFLLGNLYFDQVWWGVALEHYIDTIKKNGQYRSNGVINRNVIQMLSSGKTQQRAVNFLRGQVGHPAVQYLKTAAAHDPNPTVKKQAQALLRVIH